MAWAGRDRVTLGDVVDEPLVGCSRPSRHGEPSTPRSPARPRPDPKFAEAANGPLAQALFAAGRGDAVVSDDPRYDLVALPIGVRRPRELIGS